jgi:hypothetical protein
MKNIVLIFTALLLVSCATSYQSYGMTGGYKDKKLGPNKFEVYFQGNGVTSIEKVTEYWHKRAFELCEGGYDYEFLENGHDDNTIYAGATPIFVSYPTIIGVVECKSEVSNNQSEQLH